MCYIPSVLTASECENYNSSAVWTSFMFSTWKEWVSLQDNRTYGRCVEPTVSTRQECEESGEGVYFPFRSFFSPAFNTENACNGLCKLYEFDTSISDEATCNATGWCSANCSDIPGGCTSEESTHLDLVFASNQYSLYISSGIV